MNKHLLIAGMLLSASFLPSYAGEVDVIGVKVKGKGPDYTFIVTVEHADTGWDHYADGWEVVGEDGTIYGKRILGHPHVEEQPFTRSGKATIPEGVKSVIIRAHDSVHEYGGEEMTVELPNR